MAYDSGGNYYNDKPSSHCIYCHRKLESSGEYNTCLECQNKNIKSRVVEE